MTDFTIRSGSVDVEEIMRQVRARISEKRGVDYTEEEIRELASVKLERFLDPAKVRSDLMDHYRARVPQPDMPTTPDLPPRAEMPELPPIHLPSYNFEEDTIYASSRGVVGQLLRVMRRLLNPILKLFFNPNPIIHALHVQSQINQRLIHDARLGWIGQRLKVRDELDVLNYQVLNNLVVELTRLGIETKNLKMRVESLSSRLDFDERRARALEGVVQYRPTEATPGTPQAAPTEDEGEADTEGAGTVRRRRRRRRGRRRGSSRPRDAASGPARPGPRDKASAADGSSESPPSESEAPSADAGPEPTNDDGQSEP